MTNSPMRVFISYTGRDLAAHADVVAAVLRKLEVLAIDHRDSGATGQPSVSWCFEQVDASDIVIVLLAHRYGWVPPVAEGGDGHTCITWLEVRRAREKGKIVLPYVVDEDASWPTEMIEGLRKPELIPRISTFRAELSRTVAAFFTNPDSLDGPVSRDIPKAIARLRIDVGALPSTRVPTPRDDAEVSVPWIYDRDNPPSVADRMDPSLPKRILCLDSYGADAILALSHLERIERLLQVRYGESSFRLADYFDLVVGSGFGAVLATEIALGQPVNEIRPKMKHLLADSFHHASLFERMHHAFDFRPLERILNSTYSTVCLADGPFITALALVATRLELGLPCHFTNAPNDPSRLTDGTTPICKLLLGCVSHLTFYPPVLLKSNASGDRAICSGSASGTDDPTLYAILVSTSPQYSFNWRLGLNRMLVVSIGGGDRTYVKSAKEVANSWLLKQVVLLASSFSRSARYTSTLMLESLGSGLGNPRGSTKTTQQVLTSKRYETPLDASFLRNVGLVGLTDRLARMAEFDCVELFGELDTLGGAAAKHSIDEELLLPSFDVRRLLH